MKRRVIAVLTIVIVYTTNSAAQVDPELEKQQEAIEIGTKTLEVFVSLFKECLESGMSAQNFVVDELRNYVNFPHMTTIGVATRYTLNRKFFANMIQSAAFKMMLDKDLAVLRKNYVKKMRFCDTAVMDQDLVRDFYDREVDPSKMK